MTAAVGTAPPGWYPDPEDPARRRWWDGQRWAAAGVERPRAVPAAAGWYRDPRNRQGWRWWDGAAWTRNATVPRAPARRPAKSRSTAYYAGWLSVSLVATVAAWWLFLLAFAAMGPVCTPDRWDAGTWLLLSGLLGGGGAVMPLVMLVGSPPAWVKWLCWPLLIAAAAVAAGVIFGGSGLMIGSYDYALNCP